MIFLDLNNIKVELKQYNLDQMLDNDYSLLDEIELSSIERVKAYTNSIANIDYEISQVKEKRNPDLVRVLNILVRYDAESRLATNGVSENTTNRYNEVIKYLISIQQKEIKPTWLLKDDSEEDYNTSLFSSLPQQTRLF